jgi:hypothetical protein
MGKQSWIAIWEVRLLSVWIGTGRLPGEHYFMIGFCTFLNEIVAENITSPAHFETIG